MRAGCRGCPTARRSASVSQGSGDGGARRAGADSAPASIRRFAITTRQCPARPSLAAPGRCTTRGGAPPAARMMRVADWHLAHPALPSARSSFQATTWPPRLNQRQAQLGNLGYRSHRARHDHVPRLALVGLLGQALGAFGETSIQVHRLASRGRASARHGGGRDLQETRPSCRSSRPAPRVRAGNATPGAGPGSRRRCPGRAGSAAARRQRAQGVEAASASRTWPRGDLLGRAQPGQVDRARSRPAAAERGRRCRRASADPGRAPARPDRARVSSQKIGVRARQRQLGLREGARVRRRDSPRERGPIRGASMPERP